MEATLQPVKDPEPALDGAGNVAFHWNWEMRDGLGRALGRFGKVGDPPLGSAMATLRADHGYPEGQWVTDGDGYRFVTGEGS